MRVLSHSVMSDSLQLHELQPTRLLCPWHFPGKSTGVGCHAFSVRSLQVALIPCPDDHIQKNYREETVGQETVLKLSFHL